jgi:CRISPR/Cas system-associated exonuclease Cas4 (RecB family)
MALYTKRAWNLFDPASTAPFNVSRSKVDLFFECPRCFYMDRRLGVSRPSMPAFSLNNAVDELMKKEFDIHRAKKTAHPLMKAYGIDAVPLQHESMEAWRDARKRGIRFVHTPTNLEVSGGIDDVWVSPSGELIIVDYKATSTRKEISLDDQWKAAYKRQVEVYQWLFRQNGFPVSKTAYFVFCNGDADKNAFDGKLEFAVSIIPYVGNDAWIEGTLQGIRECLTSTALPEPGSTCEHCSYRAAARAFEVERPSEPRQRTLY